MPQVLHAQSLRAPSASLATASGPWGRGGVKRGEKENTGAACGGQGERGSGMHLGLVSEPEAVGQPGCAREGRGEDFHLEGLLFISSGSLSRVIYGLPFI